MKMSLIPVAHCLIALALSALEVRAAVQVSPNPTSGPQGQSAVDILDLGSDASGHHWGVSFLSHAPSGYYSVIVTASSTDIIDFIFCNAGTISSPRIINLDMSTFAASIGEIAQVNSNGELRLNHVRAQGDIGEITANSLISVVSQSGSLLGNIEIETTGHNTIGDILEIDFASGSINGNIRYFNGGIGSIVCKSINGSVNAPVIISCTGQLTSLLVNDGTETDATDSNAAYAYIIDPDLLGFQGTDPSAYTNRTMSVGDVRIGHDFSGRIWVKELASIEQTPFSPCGVPVNCTNPGLGEFGQPILARPAIRIGHDFSGSMDVVAGLRDLPGCTLVNGQIYSPYLMAVGHSVTAGSRIHVPDAPSSCAGDPSWGINGIVACNVGDATGLFGPSDGLFLGQLFLGTREVVFHDVTYARGTPPFPDETGQESGESMESFGGGVVGRAPYGLNGVASGFWLAKTDGTVRGPFSEPEPNRIFKIDYVPALERIMFKGDFLGPVISTDGSKQTPARSDGHIELEYLPPTIQSANSPNLCWRPTGVRFLIDQISPSRMWVYGGWNKDNTCTENYLQPCGFAPQYVPDDGSMSDPKEGTAPPGSPAFLQSPNEAMLRNGYTYRLRINTQAASGMEVYSDLLGLGGPNPLSPHDAVVFQVGCPCIGDYNGDAARNTLDLIILLGQFGQSAMCDQPPLTADVNGDNAVNTADLVELLSRFGIACSVSCGEPSQLLSLPQGEQGGTGTLAMSRQSLAIFSGDEGPENGQAGNAPGSVVVGTPPGPVLIALGFQSAEAFQSYFDGLDETAQLAYIQVLVAVGRSLGY